MLYIYIYGFNGIQEHTFNFVVNVPIYYYNLLIFFCFYQENEIENFLNKLIFLF